MAEHLELDYETVQNVVDSWEELLRQPNYDVDAGTLLFADLFDKCPPAKQLFGFPVDIDTCCEKLKKNTRFVAHAKHMIAMLDRAVHMLGPDVELLEEVLLDLGKKHVAMGVPTETFPIFGEALMKTLRSKLGKKWNREVEESWLEVYKVLSEEMISVMNKSAK